MLVMPKPDGKSTDEWEAFELEAMKEVIGLYGKTWHFWQVDRGDKLPLGEPSLRQANQRPSRDSCINTGTRLSDPDGFVHQQ